jgi:hypothetical protein
MLQLIRRAVHVRDFKKHAPATAAGRTWLVQGGLTLLCAVAATAFAQDISRRPVPLAPRITQAAATTAAAGAPSDPQTELMSVIEPKVERDPTSLSPLGDDFSPTTGTITFSARWQR